MVENIWENGLMEGNMEKDCLLIKVEFKKKVYGKMDKDFVGLKIKILVKNNDYINFS